MNIEQEIQNILDRNFTRGDNANALKELLVLYNAVEQSEQFKCEKCGSDWGEVRAICFNCNHESEDLSI